MNRYSKMLSLIYYISNFQYCATKVDGNGNLLEFGYCNPDCLSHEQTMVWKVAETLKMTLQYDNSVIDIGMKVYGYLMTGIFIIGLILATLLPATSKIIVTFELTKSFLS